MDKIQFQNCLPPVNPPFYFYRLEYTEDGEVYYLEHHRRVFIDDQCYCDPGLRLEFQYEHFN